MTIQFPRQLPSLKIEGCIFDLQRNDVSTPEAGGSLTSSRMAEPLWLMKVDTDVANDAEFNRWCAWCDSLDGSQQKFFGQDVFNRYPLRYRRGFADMVRAGGSTPFDGTTDTWSVNDARDELSLEKLPVGLRLSERDFIGFEWDTDKRFLVSAMEDVSATSEGVGTWTVRPHIPTYIPEDAIVTIAAPTCLMKLVPGSWNLARAYQSRRISFQALQHIDE